MAQAETRNLKDRIMTDNRVNNNGVWQNRDWAERVQICQQGIANEDSLLLTLVIMFIAFEAILFTILIGGGWGQRWSIILAVFGVGSVIPYMYFFEIRGNAVDHWGEMLHGLWEEAGQQELAQYYKGCVERRYRRQQKRGRWIVIFGWGHPFDMGRFKSTRRWFTTFIPLGLVIIWILLMVESFSC